MTSRRPYKLHKLTDDELALRSALGRRIRRLRLAQKRFNQEELAAEIEVVRTHMSTIELGGTDLRFSTLVRIAAALELTVDKLVQDLPSEPVVVDEELEARRKRAKGISVEKNASKKG